MKVLFFIAFVAAVLWSGFVWFANAMKPAETGGFIGRGSIAVAFLVVAVFGLAAWFG